MKLKTKEIENQIIEAENAFSNKDYNQAVSILHNIITNHQEYAPAYRKLAAILMQTNTPKNALPYLNKAIELARDEEIGWTLLIKYYQIIDEIDNVLAVYKRSLDFIPKSISLRWEYAKLLQKQDQKIEAFTQYEILINNTDNLPIDIVQSWFDLAISFRMIKIAREKLEKLLQDNPQDMTILKLYGEICYLDMDTNTTLDTLDKRYKIAPNNADIFFSQGVIYIELGNIQKGIESLYRANKLDPLNLSALLTLSSHHKFEKNDNLFQNLNFAYANIDNIKPESKYKLHYALGKAYDDTDQYQKAFEHFAIGGKLHAKDKSQQEIKAINLEYHRTQKYLTKEFFEKHLNQGYQSNKPLFIVGMPRSGTTLIEQVLTSIDGIHGAGETEYSWDALNMLSLDDDELDFGARLSHFSQANPTLKERGECYIKLIKSISPKEAATLIDKTPNNFIWLGYLHIILPNAKFIHARRHPMETCLSAYRIAFADAQYWSDNLKTMGEYYRLYVDIMKHWREVLPSGTILDVKYEDMINDLEGTSHNMTNFIGVEWDKKCLDFHQTKRPVRTASLSQVRKPLYTTSTNRWRKYEPYLQPLLDEIGDLVEEYEAELQL